MKRCKPKSGPIPQVRDITTELGEPQVQWKYLLSDADLGEEEAQAVADVVRSKWLSVGPKTADFEAQFAEQMNAGYAIATANCTVALHLALMALGVNEDHEVLVPSYTFVASVNSILYQRAKPVFVDIHGPQDLNLDPDDLLRKITPRTKAIIVVHMAGFPADMDQIMSIAKDHQIAVVEDACHAIGAEYSGSSPSQYDGLKAGTIGDVGCFSFFANKNLVTGEGGMLLTDDEQIASMARAARSHGMTKSSWDKAEGRAAGYDVAHLGFNYRGTELMAVMGTIQLRKLDDNNARRRELVAEYRQRLGGRPEILIPFSDRLADSAHHIFPIIVNDARHRQALRDGLAERGIQTSVHYPPVHQFSHYRAIQTGDPQVEITEQVAAGEVTLPLHPLLSVSDVHTICDELEEVLDEINATHAHL